MGRMRLGCVIMAAGEGKRFAAAGGAGNKLAADVAGEPLVCRTVRSVPAERYEVVVSTRWPFVRDLVGRTGCDATVVLHDHALRGDVLRAGLDEGAARWDGCLFLSGDQPLVSRASFCALADALERDPMRAWRLAWQGRGAGPVLFPASVFAAFEEQDARAGGMALVRAGVIGEGLVEAECEQELWDVDTPADLARIDAFARQREDIASTGTGRFV